MHKIVKIFLLLVITISTSFSQDSTDYKQKYTLSEIKVTADKLNTKLKDFSSKIEIINAKKIESINGNRLPDILKTDVSTYIKSYGTGVSLQTISLNGLGAEHTLILVDGVRINSFQNSQIDLSLIPRNNIDRIEIVNNGASSIYGSNAMGGIVNIITKNSTYSERPVSISSSFSAGSYETYNHSLAIEAHSQSFNTRIQYSKETSKGNYKYNFDNGLNLVELEREHSSYTLEDISLNTRWIIDNNNFIKLMSTYSYQDKDVPGVATGSAPSPTKQYDKNWNNILVMENMFSKEVALKTSFNFQNNHMKYLVKPVTNSYYKNLVYSGAVELKVENELYNIICGYDFTHATLQSNEVDDGIKRNQQALFAASSLNPIKWLKIFPSVRYDYISDIDKGAFTYKLGINLQPFDDTGLSLKGNFGRNFRSPSFNDLYWKTGGNKELRPEYSTNSEAGILYGFHSVIEGQFEITYIHVDAKDKIVWMPTSSGFWAPVNFNESVSNTLSIAAKASREFSEHLSLSLDAGLQITSGKKTSASHANDNTLNKYVPYIPLRTGKINLSASFHSIDINLFYTYSGKRYSDFANNDAMPVYHMLDCNISTGIKLGDVHSKLKFEINNLTNTDYEILKGYPMPLRNYRLTLFINY